MSAAEFCVVRVFMNVRLATDADRERWNAYLDMHQDVPPFARYEWRDVMESAYRTPTYFFLAEDASGSINGVCATYVTKPWKGNSVLYSMRFGLLVNSKEFGAVLLKHIEQFFLQERIGSYLLTSGYKQSAPDTLVSVKKTLVLDIAGSEEALWSGLHNKTRNMIRKAERSGLHIEYGFNNLEAFYRIYVQRMLEKGVLIHPMEFFERIAEKCAAFAELLLVKHGDIPVGGMLLLMGKQSALYPYQASLQEGERFASNQLLIWEAMRICQRRGIQTLDMGESREGGSVYQSKVNFGGTPRDVYYYSSHYGPTSKFSAMPAFIFAKAPLWIRRRIGPWIKRQGRII